MELSVLLLRPAVSQTFLNFLIEYGVLSGFFCGFVPFLPYGCCAAVSVFFPLFVFNWGEFFFCTTMCAVSALTLFPLILGPSSSYARCPFSFSPPSFSPLTLWFSHPIFPLAPPTSTQNLPVLFSRCVISIVFSLFFQVVVTNQPPSRILASLPLFFNTHVILRAIGLRMCLFIFFPFVVEPTVRFPCPFNSSHTPKRLWTLPPTSIEFFVFFFLPPS